MTYIPETWSPDAGPITVPCVVDGMPDEAYHSDPVEGGSLSSTGARAILKSPARFDWERTHRVNQATYDTGHAVHAKVLGVGPEVVLVVADSWRTNAAKAARDEAYAAGKVPILVDDYAPILAMAEAVLAHRTARALLELPGAPEQSAFAQDPRTGTWLRARVDRLPEPGRGRTILVDLKTAVSAEPNAFARAAADHGYHQQDTWYQDAVRLARGDDDTAFVFVVVEKDPPYLVSVVELDDTARQIGRDRNRRAIDLYTQCTRTGDWPGYGTAVQPIHLPRWVEIQHEEFV